MPTGEEKNPMGPASVLLKGNLGQKNLYVRCSITLLDYYSGLLYRTLLNFLANPSCLFGQTFQLSNLTH